MAGVLPLFKKKKETILSLETIELYASQEKPSFLT
jgi:hypothetical protein